ncbi:hypothetical protein O9993_17660 [Vibrio lentus]|nr:hypothetical protein [Vibrio lentus]
MCDSDWCWLPCFLLRQVWEAKAPRFYLNNIKMLFSCWMKPMKDSSRKRNLLAYRYLSGDGAEQNDEKAAGVQVKKPQPVPVALKPNTAWPNGLSGSGVQVGPSGRCHLIGLAAAQDYDPALDLLH